MTKEFYEHIETNLPTFNLWIENHSRLQISADILQPLVPVFMEANPTTNLNGCQDCIIDMLIWCRDEYRKRATVNAKAAFAEKLDKTVDKIIKNHKTK